MESQQQGTEQQSIDVSIAMRVHVGDFLKTTAELSAEEVGVHVRMLVAAWTREGVVPDDQRRLARLAGVDAGSWPAVWAGIAHLWRATDRGLVNDRLAADLAVVRGLRQQAVERGRKGRQAQLNRAGGAGPTVPPSSRPSRETIYRGLVTAAQAAPAPAPIEQAKVDLTTDPNDPTLTPQQREELMDAYVERDRRSLTTPYDDDGLRLCGPVAQHRLSQEEILRRAQAPSPVSPAPVPASDQPAPTTPPAAGQASGKPPIESVESLRRRFGLDPGHRDRQTNEGRLADARMARERLQAAAPPAPLSPSEFEAKVADMKAQIAALQGRSQPPVAVVPIEDIEPESGDDEEDAA